MIPCEEWASALEKEAAGTLGPAETRALEAHLARCDACRAAHEALAELKEALPPGELPPPTDWERFRPRFTEADRSYRRDLGRGLLAALLFGALFLIGHRIASGRLFDPFGLGVISGAAFGILAVLLWGWRELRKARAFAEGDLFALLERRYLRRIRTLTWFAPLYPPLMAGVMWNAFPHIGSRGPALAVVTAAFAVACGASVYGFFFARRRLRRELAQLRGER
jgi:hypothetical protein